MRLGIVRTLAVAVLVALWGVTWASTSHAAGPWLMLIEGDLLPERVIIGEWEDVQVFYLSVAGFTEEDLSGRPYLRVTVFSNPRWQGYVPEGKPLELVRSADGDEHLRFYPAFESRPAVTTQDPPIPPGYSRAPAARIVGDPGLEVLHRYGVPIAITPDAETGRFDGRIWVVLGSVALLSIVLLASVTLQRHRARAKHHSSVASS